LKELEEEVRKEIAALRVGEKTLEKGRQELKEYAEASKKVAEDTNAFEKEINELSGKLRKVDKALDVDAFEQLKKELKDLGVEGISNAESLAEIEKVLKGLDNEAIAPVTAALNNMISSLDKLGEEQKSVAGEIDKTSEALKEQNEAAKQKEAFEARIKQFLGLAGAAQVLRRALTDAFRTISELDSVMGQMAVVTDLSVGDYWD
jgi:chromosome segregation ATPase